MGSSRPTDRSLGETTFLPQWMKGKIDARFDYSDSTFSPPADDFFYIRYPKQHQEACSAAFANNSKEGFRPLNEVLGNKEQVAKTADSAAAAATSKTSCVDYSSGSRHPLSCQSFIPFSGGGANVVLAASEKVNEPKLIVANKPKEASDEFPAESGRSIVHVAHQIMSSTFGKASSAESADDAGYHYQRRGSKSLPVTPIASPSGTPDSSPKSRRRIYGNRYFTGAYLPDPERKNGWLLSSILGQSREMAQPMKIVEEEEQQQVEPQQLPARAMSRKKSISSQNLTYLGKENEQASGGKPQILQVKPSELREMNFWSPTSM